MNAATLARAIGCPLAVRLGHASSGGQGEARGHAVDPAVDAGCVGDVQEAVGQRRGQVPAVGRSLGRVGGGDDLHRARQQQVADAALERHAQHGRLDGGRRGGQLVEEEVAGLRGLQPLRPGGRLQAHAIVGDDGQAREVAGLAQ